MRRFALALLVVASCAKKSANAPQEPEATGKDRASRTYTLDDDLDFESTDDEAKPEEPKAAESPPAVTDTSIVTEKLGGKRDEWEHAPSGDQASAEDGSGERVDKPADPDGRLVEVTRKADKLKQRTLATRSKVVLLGEVTEEEPKSELKEEAQKARQMGDLEKAVQEQLRAGKSGLLGPAAADPAPANMPVMKVPAQVEVSLDGYAADLEVVTGLEDGRYKLQLSTLTLGKVIGNDLHATLPHSPMEKPTSFIPRTCYFENAYLGGNAAYLERMRRLDEALAGAGAPHRLAHADAQAFDPPERSGMALTASIDTRWLDKPGRVFLQVGLRGSDRFGWRRPPLELVLVIDAPAIADSVEPAVETLAALLRGLGAQDRLAVIVSGARGSEELAPLSRLRALQSTLPAKLDALAAPAATDAGALAEAMAAAGRLLKDASENRTTLPGTQTVLVLTRGDDAARVAAAQKRSHALMEQGVVTSVVELEGGTQGAWWAVAEAGYGSYHRIGAGGAGAAIDAELESLSRVVARLLRVNIRLAPGVEAVRVLGSKVLGEEEKRLVKAREVAADKNIARSMGLKSDRGEDDDGIQSVIPYFLGGESHVIVLELWVEKPGKVADITLRYKDMVTLGNATAAASAELRNVPRPVTGEQIALSQNLHGFRIAEVLLQAAERATAGDPSGAAGLLRTARGAAGSDGDARLLASFERLLGQQPGATTIDALRVAAERRIGDPRP